MTEQDALKLVERKRSALGITPGMSLDAAERAIVQYKKNPKRPGPAEDRVAWIITYASPMKLVIVHVDDRRGIILSRVP